MQLSHYNLKYKQTQDLKLREDEGEYLKGNTGIGTAKPKKPKRDLLSQILDALNDLLGSETTEGDSLNFMHGLATKLSENTSVMAQIRHNSDTAVMERDEYQKADLLIISDFIMAGLPENMLEEINTQRANDNRFYSLVVGPTYMDQRLQSLFDQEWVFNPETSHIHELVSFQERIRCETAHGASLREA